MAIAYGIFFALSLLMPPVYFIFIRKKQNEPWLFMLFVCISIVNFGYLLVAFSKTVEFAIWANKITYLGQVFVPMCMFLLISRLCGYVYKRWQICLLICLAIVMFAIIFTTGYLDWYYTDVKLGKSAGATYLIKEYGVLHPTNLIYVVTYFVVMLVVAFVSLIREKDGSQKLAGLMLAVVLCNIGMWIIEKIISWNFEFLSISYLMSEFAFFFVYLLLQDYILKTEVPEQPLEKTRVIVLNSIPKADKLAKVLSLVPENKKLTTRQLEMLDGLLDGKSQKEIAADLHISENTVKWHMGILYTTLNVSGRDEIYALFK